MNLKGIIFDLDGTLADTLPLIYAAFRHSFALYLGRQFTDRQIKDLFGPSEEGIFEQIAGDSWEECFQTYLAFYDDAHDEYVQQVAGITELLEQLQEAGIKLAIVTGKGERSTMITLHHLELMGYFTEISCGSPSGPEKPKAISEILDKWQLLPREVAYVGDAPSDMAASTQVGTVSLCARWTGTPYDRQQLEDSGAENIFASPSELGEWVQRRAAKLK